MTTDTRVRSRWGAGDYVVVGLLILGGLWGLSTLGSEPGPVIPALSYRLTGTDEQLELFNDNTMNWSSAELKLNDRYTCSIEWVPAQGQVTIQTRECADSSGNRFSRSQKVVKATLTAWFGKTPRVAIQRFK